jgi:hypothetical protein
MRRILAGLAIAPLLVLSGTGSVSAATVATHEGETFTGTAAAVLTDSTASGGSFLFQDSAFTVSKRVTLTSAANSLVVRLHGDGNLRYEVYADGAKIGTYTETSTAWVDRTVGGSWAAGSHTFGFKPINVDSQNLYLDKVTLNNTNTSTEQRMQGYVTGYSYWDNTPPGSSEISHPQLHNVAAGTGTYADPITVAVGHTLSGGNDILDWPAGTRFYVPFVRRYFIVEDTCGDGATPQNGPCHTGYPAPAVTWIDVWVGGGGQSREASDECMENITDVHLVIKDPASNYAVVPGELTANCTTYNETPST